MWELFTATENLPFSVAITLMLAISVLEGVTAVMGMALSELFDTLTPDFELDMPDASDTPALSQFLGWLRVGEVPLLILFIVFLLTFGLSGFVLQSAFSGVTGRFMSPLLAVGAAGAIALPSVHFLGGVLAAVLPRDETEAVAEASFLGQTATIVLGSARRGSPAQAKLKDAFGQTHYVMFEPLDDVVVETGSSVILQEVHGHIYRGVSAALVDNRSDRDMQRKDLSKGEEK